jgi:hypothetical protein
MIVRNRSRRMTVVGRGFASGTRVPGRVFDSADEPRLGALQFMRLRDSIEARAARKFSDVELEGNPPA